VLILTQILWYGNLFDLEIGSTPYPDTVHLHTHPWHKYLERIFTKKNILSGNTHEKNKKKIPGGRSFCEEEKIAVRDSDAALQRKNERKKRKHHYTRGSIESKCSIVARGPGFSPRRWLSHLAGHAKSSKDGGNTTGSAYRHRPEQMCRPMGINVRVRVCI
jgi:hypothetical protein